MNDVFLDIGLGILIALLVSAIFGNEPSVGFLGWGVTFILLPEIDLAYSIIQNKAFNGPEVSKHRTFAHVPIVYLMLGTAIAWRYVGAEWAVLFALTLLAHYIHDSVGMGWGVRWLGPFSKSAYKFFANAEDGSWDWHTWVVTWDPDQLDRVAYEHGNRRWFFENYVMFSPTLVVENLFLLFAFSVLSLAMPELRLPWILGFATGVVGWLIGSAIYTYLWLPFRLVREAELQRPL